jgi:2-polyprenyl-3-methyl-5-hydroxy-6-metoxy-1,4-benzoquinol methylase
MIDPIRLEDVACPLGCAKDDKKILVGRDLLHGLPGVFTVVKCRCCGLLRTNPRPAPESMGSFYPDDYGPYQQTRVAQADPKPASPLKNLLRSFADRAFKFNIQCLPSLRPGRLLEIGCASGSFLNEMAKKGWQVQGIEFSAKAAAEVSQLGFPVHAGPLESAPKPQEPFDLIVGWMVLEHLHDPIAVLKKLRACAKPGAWLALSVPNVGSLDFRVFKDNLYSLHLPNHLYHFSPKTLGKVLCAGGWALDRISHQRVLTNFVVSTGYVLRARGHAKCGQKFIDFPKRSKRWVYAFYPLAWILGFFGQTGRMTVWARVDS